MTQRRFAFIVFVSFLITGFAPAGDTVAVTTIQFKHWAGNKELHLFEETYTNSFGEPFVVSKFKYYISHITVTDINNRETVLPNSYYLVNEEDSLSKSIQLPVAPAFKSISFIVGVDSARNVGGVQTGSLDPVNAMFWTWNSGYVFAKLEGQSDASTAPAHSFSWHAGGFRQKENALRKITLPITIPLSPAQPGIVINVNILKWFDAVHPLKIASTPVCHQPGVLAMQIADNYSAMFSIAP
jgi:hypothetical protein